MFFTLHNDAIGFQEKIRSSALFTPPAQHYNDLFSQKLAKEPEPLETEYLFIVMLFKVNYWSH